MLRKYLVLGIMMGALALTGCEMFEEIEHTLPRPPEYKNKENTDINSNEADNKKENTDLKQINPTEGLHYLYEEKNVDVREWEVYGGKKCCVTFYTPEFGPESDGTIKYIKSDNTRLTLAGIDKVGDKTLEEVLSEEYDRWAKYAGINQMDMGEIKNVTGEYVTVNGIECYKYTGTANEEIYVTGYMLETEERWVMLQIHVCTEDEKDIQVAKEEADHNIEVVIKGLGIRHIDIKEITDSILNRKGGVRKSLKGD